MPLLWGDQSDLRFILPQEYTQTPETRGICRSILVEPRGCIVYLGCGERVTKWWSWIIPWKASVAPNATDTTSVRRRGHLGLVHVAANDMLDTVSFTEVFGQGGRGP